MDWIEVNGTALRYELTGSADRTLVLVHEMGGTLESWDGVLPALSNTWRVLRYDVRGAGMSEKISAPVTFDTMADDLAALLDALGIHTPVALAGCAVGAGIALRFTTRFPHRVAALVAMAPATAVAPERRAATETRAAAIAAKGPRGVIEDSFAASYPLELRTDQNAYHRFRARWLGNDPESYAAIYRMLITAGIEADFPRITTPTLLIAGTHDRLRPPPLVQTVAQRIPGARFKELDTGHFMAVQTPAPVAAAIVDFLATVAH